MASITAGAIAGLASAGAGLAGSVISSNQQQKAAQQAGNNLSPFRVQGVNATQVLQSMLGLPGGAPFNWQGSPGFQFALNQGMDAIENSASARGGVVSGNTLKDLQKFGTGLASQDYYNYLGALQGLAGLGENAAAGQGNFLTQAGNASAAGTVGASNAAGNIASLLPFLFGGNNNNIAPNIAPLNSTIASGASGLTGAGADPSAVFGTGGLAF